LDCPNMVTRVVWHAKMIVHMKDSIMDAPSYAVLVTSKYVSL